MINISVTIRFFCLSFVVIVVADVIDVLEEKQRSAISGTTRRNRERKKKREKKNREEAKQTDRQTDRQIDR